MAERKGTSKRNQNIRNIEDNLKGSCTEEDFQMISEKLQKSELIILGRFLELPKLNIERIGKELLGNNPELICQVLKDWNTSKGEMATRDVLIEALKNIQRNDIVNEVFADECTKQELLKVSGKIRKIHERRSLAQILGISDQTVDKIEKLCTEKEYGEAEMMFQILREWKRMTTSRATKYILMNALRNIRREEVINYAFIEYQSSNHQSLTGIQKDIQRIQKLIFRKIQLPRSLGLEKNQLPLESLFMELEMEIEANNLEKENICITVEDIFKKYTNNAPRRILIEGNPMHGKTTLVLKLISDWSNEKNYINNKFDMVFVIPLRHYKGDLKMHLIEQCENVNGSNEEKIQAIESIEERVLLLLDGFDETSQVLKEGLIPLLKRDQYPNMTVIVTSKTGYQDWNLINNDIFKLQYTNQKISWDKIIVIKGIVNESKSEFLKKFLSINDQDLGKRLSSFTIRLNDFYKCPLFLLLLGVFLQNNQSRCLAYKTELHKFLFNFVINRNLIRENLLDEETEVFDLDPSSRFCYRSLILSFGKLCMEKLKDNRVLFEKCELSKYLDSTDQIDMIFKLGFLCKEIDLSNEEKSSYELLHKYLLQFLAAFYICSLTDHEIENEIGQMLSSGIFPEGNQFLYVFIGGLLQNDAYKLLNSLSYYKKFISIFYDKYLYAAESILSEIPQNETILKSLTTLSSGNWEYIEYKPDLHNWYVEFFKYLTIHGIDEKLSLRIPENERIIQCFPDNFNVDSIKITINTFQSDVFNNFGTKNLHCRNLVIHSVASTDGFPCVLKQFLSAIKADNIWLKAEYEHLQQKFINNEREKFNLFLDINQEKLLGVNFYYLSLHKIDIAYFKLISSRILNLLKKNKISYGFNINFSSSFKHTKSITKELNSFVTELASNIHLKSLGIKHFFIDPLLIPTFSSKSENQRKFIALRGRFKANSNKLNSFATKHLNCIHLNLETGHFISTLLSKCKALKRISIYPELITNLNACDSRSKTELEKIERIDMRIEWPMIDDKTSFLSGISLFKNVREIYIVLSCINHRYNDLLFKLVYSLKQLQKFSLYLDHCKDEEFINDFLLKLASNKNTGDDVKFEELQIENLHINTYASKKFIESLENCFRANTFLTFSTLDRPDWDNCEFLKYFILNNDYGITSEWIEDFNVYQMISVGVDEFPERRQKLYISKK